MQSQLQKKLRDYSLVDLHMVFLLSFGSKRCASLGRKGFILLAFSGQDSSAAIVGPCVLGVGPAKFRRDVIYAVYVSVPNSCEGAVVL